MKINYKSSLLDILLISLVILIGVSCQALAETQSPATNTVPNAAPAVNALAPAPTTSNALTNSVPLAVTDFSTAIRNVAQMDKPAVVQITNEQVQLDQFN